MTILRTMLIYVPAMFASAVEPAGGVVEAGVPHDEPSDERHDPSEPKLLAHRLERRAGKQNKYNK